MRSQADWREELAVFETYPIPISDDKYELMPSHEKLALHEATFIQQALRARDVGFFCLYISEVFYAYEAFCRAICCALCWDFLESVLDESVVMHGHVWKALKRLGADRNTASKCKECRFAESCTRHAEGPILAAIYLRLFHLRVLRDYRENIYMDGELLSYVTGPLEPMCREASFLAEEYLASSLGGFLMMPASLRDTAAVLSQIGLIQEEKSNKMGSA